MKERIVFFQEGSLFLNTCMSNSDFVKARFSERIRENGVLAEKEGGQWNCSPWNFDSTVSSRSVKGFCEDGKETVFLEGTAFDGMTLHEMLEGSCPSSLQAAAAFCSAVQAAAEKKFPVDGIGGGGIFISADLKKILFLPKIFFVSAVSSFDERTFGEQQGQYVHPAFNAQSNVRFIQAVVLYRVICKSFPFAAEKTSARTADMLDLNYRPLRYLACGIDRKIILFTEHAFSGKNAEFPEKEFSLFAEKNEPFIHNPENFTKKAERYFSRQQKRLRVRRWLRARRTAIGIAAVAAAAVIIVSSSLYRTSQEKRTAKGLTSLQALEMYYSAINCLDVDSAGNASAKKLRRRTDMLSTVFVTGKTRAMYDVSLDIVPPAVWIVKNQPKHNIYGLSQFTVDGAQGDIFFQGPRKSERPEVLHEENGQAVVPGMEKQYSVSFFILDSSGEDMLAVTRQVERVFAVFEKDRWIIADIQTELESEYFPFSEFKEAYAQAMKQCGSDILAAARLLRKKYSFIPSDEEIAQAKEFIQRESLFYSSS